MRSPCLVVAFLAVTFLEAAIGQSPSISAAAAAQKKRDADKKSKKICLSFEEKEILSEVNRLSQGRRDLGYPCRGGDSCCSPSSSSQCGFAEGDCDQDGDCLGPLVCGSNNCRELLEVVKGSADGNVTRQDDGDC